MGVMAVRRGYKQEKEKRCNDIGCSCVTEYVVEVFLCRQGIDCRWRVNKACRAKTSAE